MRLPTNLPRLLVDEGARRLALAHLEDANAARSRLRNASDSEALHDYRVALRRLRCCLRAYRKHLRSTVSRKNLRQLRRLARGTNQSRDLEVHLAWLREQQDQLGKAEQPGVSWALERLTVAKRRDRDAMLRLDETLFPRIYDRLAVQLSVFRTSVQLDADLTDRSTAAVTANLVRRASRRLRRRLSLIRGYLSEAQIHQARIAAKRLRYLLDPLIGDLPEGAAVVHQLKTLQDAFGDVHDVHVFVAELVESVPEAASATLAGADLLPGHSALISSLRTRGYRAFSMIAPGWLGDGATGFFTRVDAVADSVAGLAGHGVEIERSFLLTGLPSLDQAEGPVEIEQAYLPGGHLASNGPAS